MLNPADPASAGVFNSATNNLRLQGLEAAARLDEVEAFRQDVMKLAHLPEHPRQRDRKVSDWDWGNVFLARRTDAFVRTVFDLAGEPSLQAFAFGVLSSYTSTPAVRPTWGRSWAGPVVPTAYGTESRLTASEAGSPCPTRTYIT
ncbi:MAG: hypothetical protein JWO93_62 [Micrococcaceae bacterium]|nr:hypothetical protein [Micrococcaceae bacterium]